MECICMGNRVRAKERGVILPVCFATGQASGAEIIEIVPDFQSGLRRDIEQIQCCLRPGRCNLYRQSSPLSPPPHIIRGW